MGLLSQKSWREQLATLVAQEARDQRPVQAQVVANKHFHVFRVRFFMSAYVQRGNIKMPPIRWQSASTRQSRFLTGTQSRSSRIRWSSGTERRRARKSWWRSGNSAQCRRPPSRTKATTRWTPFRSACWLSEHLKSAKFNVSLRI